MKYYWTLIALLVVALSGCSIQSTQVNQTAVPIDQAAATLNIPSKQQTPEELSSAKGFKVSYRIETGSNTINAHTYFQNGFVVEILPGEQKASTVFDLHSMSWQESTTGRTIRFSDCQDWIDASVKKTQALLATTKESLDKRFTRSMLAPDFDVQVSSDGSLTLKNEFVIYKIVPSQPVSEWILEQFYAYEQMGACRDAMVQQQLPPFVRYALNDELKAHLMFPSEIELTFKMPSGDQFYKTFNAIEEISQPEQEMIAPFLPK